MVSCVCCEVRCVKRFALRVVLCAVLRVVARVAL